MSHSAEEPERNLARLAEAERLVQELPDPAGPVLSTVEGLALPHGDRLRLARIHHWLGLTYSLLNQVREAVRYLRSAEVVARELGDAELLATTSAVLGRMLARQGHFAQAQALLTRVAAPLERVVNWRQWIYNMSFLGVALAARGQVAAGLAAGERALALDNHTATLSSYLVLAIIHLMAGDTRRMLEQSRAGQEAAEQSDDRLFSYIALGLCAWAESRLGHHEAAQKFIARSQATSQGLGGQLLLSDWFAAAEIALNAGRLEEALTLAEQAVASAQVVDGLFAQGLAHRVWAIALRQAESGMIQPAALSPHPAEIHLAASLQAFKAGEARLEAARTHLVWGLLCRDRQDHAAAAGHFEQAVAQFEISGLGELAQTRLQQAALNA